MLRSTNVFLCKNKEFNVNIRAFTKFVFVFVVLTLIVGLSACDQFSQFSLPTTPEMEGLKRRNSDWPFFTADRAICHCIRLPTNPTRL